VTQCIQHVPLLNFSATCSLDLPFHKVNKNVVCCIAFGAFDWLIDCHNCCQPLEETRYDSIGGWHSFPFKNHPEALSFCVNWWCLCLSLQNAIISFIPAMLHTLFSILPSWKAWNLFMKCFNKNSIFFIHFPASCDKTVILLLSSNCSLLLLNVLPFFPSLCYFKAFINLSSLN